MTGSGAFDADDTISFSGPLSFGPGTTASYTSTNTAPQSASPL